MSPRARWTILLGLLITLLAVMHRKSLPTLTIFAMQSRSATNLRGITKSEKLSSLSPVPESVLWDTHFIDATKERSTLLFQTNQANQTTCQTEPNGRENSGSKDSEKAFIAWKAKQDERKRLLCNVCTAQGKPPLTEEQEINTILSNKHMLQNLWASEHQKVIYCPLAKVACSSWRLLFLQMSPAFNWNQSSSYRHRVHDPVLLAKHGLKSLREYSNTEDVMHMLKSFPKFIIVRHPYARLHSAFTEKFTFRRGKWNEVYAGFWGREIIKTYSKNPSEESLRTGHNVSFADFLHFISDKDSKVDSRKDPHWAPFYRYCFPCQVKYDYILKLETMKEDSEQLLGHVFNTSLRLKSLNTVGQTNISAYDDVPRPYMSDLFDAYKLDFDYFGYKI